MTRTARSVILLAALSLPALVAQQGASHFATFEGNRVHYLSYGTGPDAAVFIHGWTCDATFWSGQAPVYEKRRALLIDLPGHGRSDKPEVAYTMDYFARAVAAVMDDAKVRRATLIGHSMGTPVAAEVLRLYPAKVAGLVIVDGFVPQPPKDDAGRAQQKARQEGMAKALTGPDSAAFTTRMIESMFSKETTPAMREKIRATMLAAPRHVMVSAMDGMATMVPVSESFPQVPAAAIMMKRADSAGYRTYLEQHFRLVDFQEFENAGHFVMVDEPERFNTALARFLDRKER